MNAANFASGMYFYSRWSGEFNQTRSMTMSTSIIN